LGLSRAGSNHMGAGAGHTRVLVPLLLVRSRAGMGHEAGCIPAEVGPDRGEVGPDPAEAGCSQVDPIHILVGPVVAAPVVAAAAARTDFPSRYAAGAEWAVSSCLSYSPVNKLAAPKLPHFEDFQARATSARAKSDHGDVWALTTVMCAL